MAKEGGAEATKDKAGTEETPPQETPPAVASGGATVTSDPYGTSDSVAAPPAEATTATSAVPAETEVGTNGEANGEDVPEAPEEDDVEEMPSSTETFRAAREVVGSIHAVLDQLSSCKQDFTAEVFSERARELQHQLMVMRRTHRTMVKAGDLGRASEATARRKVDAALAHLETRRYESACLRSAGRRCRTFPTPELDRLRPNLKDGVQVEGDDPDDETSQQNSSTASSGLTKRLEAERIERQRLHTELEELEKVRATELEVIRDVQATNAELANMFRTGLQSLEPAIDKLAVKARLLDKERVDASVLSGLPSCLHLVYAKFENVASFSENSGVSVHLEGVLAKSDGEPLEKKARVVEDTGDSCRSVRVTISAGVANVASEKAFSLRFTSPGGVVIHVAPQESGPQSDCLLDCLWAEDNGLATTEPAEFSKCPGKAYYWAQVLAGLRETVSTSVPSLAAIHAVSAMDVITRVRSRLTAKGI